MTTVPTAMVSEGPSPIAPDSAFHAGIAADVSFLGGIGLRAERGGPTVRHAASSIDDAERHFAERVIAGLRQVALRYPQSALARNNLGVALLNAGEMAGAEREFAAALRLDPTLVVPALGLARIAIAAGALDAALTALLALRQSHSANPWPTMHLADVAFLRGHYDEAVELWRNALELAPELAVAQYNIGITLLHAAPEHERRAAIRHFKAAASGDARNALYRYGLGVAYAVAGQRPQAARAFSLALALDPDMLEAVRGLATVMLEEGQGTRALALLKDRIDAADYVGLELRAWAYSLQGNHRATRAWLFRAIEAFRRSGIDEPVRYSRLLNNLGACEWRLDSEEEAATHFRRALLLDPATNPDAYRNLARLLLHMRRFAEARAPLDALLARFPDDPEGRLLWATWLQEHGRTDEALAVLRATIASGEAGELTYVVAGYLLNDIAYDPPGARAVLLEGQRRFPRNPLIANNLAYAYLSEGKVAEGRALLRDITMPAGGAAEVVLRATRGLLALWEGDLRAGRTGYRQAARAAEAQGNRPLARNVRQKAHLELARALKRAGDATAALGEVRAGLAIEGVSPAYRQDLEALYEALLSAPPAASPMPH